MAKAFQCDLCDRLEEGEPDQSITVKPRQGSPVDLQPCSLCSASHNDWRTSRAPERDRPESRA